MIASPHFTLAPWSHRGHASHNGIWLHDNGIYRYGNVTSVLIFEVTTAGYEAEEAVRIFIQFDRVESATKAQIDLQVCVWTLHR